MTLHHPDMIIDLRRDLPIPLLIESSRSPLVIFVRAGISLAELVRDALRMLNPTHALTLIEMLLISGWVGIMI